ncbi:hypothetical protein IQ224_17625 [Microcystis sp. LEGE 00066]|uniref:Genome sequencing data, contig C291 n=2 Tax=Microcystis aeruginosa (strain PCC 7806) TaxID=267872 RepID=A8YDB1_MICA7|nr:MULTISPECIES: hypothetical protein [Microcystis]TRT95658.1 MAG: hypothetical protein EWV61_21935 [Microcystis aeruginosa Ma_AC_P_19900807_S300]ARI83303.1 hypothetical protein BH695_4024 [Microcystis aeruginosa PCC 7806SL]ELS46025.1 hypothetical protein C789_4182 [Microcystis aeruginosa FACHB-905 = DIANCHI905]MBE9263895.1 hypothetical protein [Microcystis sp. LEGE 00066]UGS09994.1 hypothetical protein LRR78_04740 [Microcystis aeruginosa FACHB-905 = DIANCHI905]
MTNLSIQDRINQELNKIIQALQQLEIFLRELSNQSDVMYQNALINSIALNLHGVYTRIERIFEVIAKKIDQRFPTGDKWHRDLLEQMSVDIPRVRKAVITEETRLILDELRRFRHLVRSAYSCQLDEEKVLIIAHQIVNSYQTIINDIQLFCNNLSKGKT